MPLLPIPLLLFRSPAMASPAHFPPITTGISPAILITQHPGVTLPCDAPLPSPTTPLRRKAKLFYQPTLKALDLPCHPQHTIPPATPAPHPCLSTPVLVLGTNSILPRSFHWLLPLDTSCSGSSPQPPPLGRCSLRLRCHPPHTSFALSGPQAPVGGRQPHLIGPWGGLRVPGDHTDPELNSHHEQCSGPGCGSSTAAWETTRQSEQDPATQHRHEGLIVMTNKCICLKAFCHHVLPQPMLKFSYHHVGGGEEK